MINFAGYDKIFIHIFKLVYDGHLVTAFREVENSIQEGLYETIHKHIAIGGFLLFIVWL